MVYIVEKVIGEVTHFFPKISVATIKLSAGLKIGDKVKIKDFEQAVESMQIEHNVIKEAKKGQEIGLKVNGAVKQGEKVYKVT